MYKNTFGRHMRGVSPLINTVSTTQSGSWCLLSPHYTPTTRRTASGLRLPVVSARLLAYRSSPHVARDQRASALWRHSGLGRTAQAPVQRHVRTAQLLPRDVPIP